MRNIKLAYAITYLNHSWFWGGIWILYYLRFTNYSGIGVIESMMIILTTLFEIPTGAIADLLGKKKTLILSQLFWFLGNLIMALSANYTMILISVLLATIGAAFYSGTMEAFVYDSLKEQKKENTFDKVIANITTIRLVALALSSIIGGFLYAYHPSSPFFIVACANLLAMIIGFYLVEPKVDTEHFSLKNFIFQTKMGFRELFHTPIIRIMTLFLLPIACIYVIGYEFLQDALFIDFGFKETELGILIAVVGLLAAGASQLTHKINKKIDVVKLTFLTTITTSLIFISFNFISSYSAVFLSFIRIAILVIHANITSQVINEHASSKYRATTLSTFNLIANIPYVFTAFLIGSTIDKFSASTFASYLGIFMIGILVFEIVIYIKNKHLIQSYLKQKNFE